MQAPLQNPIKIVIVGGTRGTLAANLLAKELRHEIHSGKVRVQLGFRVRIARVILGGATLATREAVSALNVPSSFQR